jgi:hypothetical protein
MYTLRVPSVSFSIARLLLAIIAVTLSIAAHAQTIHGKVVGVADGDTITVLDAMRTQHKVRLSGIDAPEKRQAFGNVSKQNLARLVFQKRSLSSTTSAIVMAESWAGWLSREATSAYARSRMAWRGTSRNTKMSSRQWIGCATVTPSPMRALRGSGYGGMRSRFRHGNSGSLRRDHLFR